MNVNYIETPSGEKLFSFHRHDFQMEEGVGIDGGLQDYVRVIGGAELKEDSVENLILDIRESFKWGKNYDKDNNPLPKTEWVLLKDLDTSHIVNILIYFTNQIKIDGINVKSSLDKQWVAYHLFFLEELKYRLGQQSAGDIESTRESN